MNVDEDGRILGGFHRVKKSYRDCPFPSKVERWCLDIETECHVPEHIQQALTQLDNLANEWPAIGKLQNRVCPNHPELTKKLLGLDFEDPRDRLRAAVARAYQATWRYADIFCDWKDARRGADDILSSIESFIGDNALDIIEHAKVRENRGYYSESTPENPGPHARMEHSFADLQQFYEETKSWAVGEKERAKGFPKNAPRLFLYTRLAEIYACCSGSMPVNYASAHFQDNRDLPERPFRAFLIPALTVVGYPSPESGLDKVLRDIAKHITDGGDGFKRLVGESDEEIEYPYLPTISLHNGLNCFSETKL